MTRQKGPERVLVLGATGHIGQAVVRRLLARGCAVTACTRQANPVPLRGLPLRIAPIDGELNGLRELVAGHDLMIDAAAPRPLGAGIPGSAGWRKVVDNAAARTLRVLDAARSHGLRLGFVSTFTTLLRPHPAGAAEAAWRRSVYPYFEAKWTMERLMLDAARAGIPVAVVNPAACLGPWEFRPASASLVPLVLSGRLPVVTDHASNVIDVRDVAAGLELALAHECYGRPIPLAGHNIAPAALAARIAEIGGGTANPLPLSSIWTSAASALAELAYASVGLPAPDEWRAVPLIGDNFPMSPSLEQLALGLRIRRLEDTLRDAVAFHRGWSQDGFNAV
jgi:nucleoside-diphosphate-sugar epimerase